jgi:hypothetical protein
MWQQWSIPHTLLTWTHLIFTYYLERNEHWRNSAFVTLLTPLRMLRKSWKCYHKIASKNVSNSLTVAVNSV